MDIYVDSIYINPLFRWALPSIKKLYIDYDHHLPTYVLDALLGNCGKFDKQIRNNHIHSIMYCIEYVIFRYQRAGITEI